MLNKSSAAVLAALAVTTLVGSTATLADDESSRKITTKLDGYQAVRVTGQPPAFNGQVEGAVSTTGRGTFSARIDRANRVITYELGYQDLEGDVLQAHIHFGRPATNGGVMVFLCTNLNNDPSPTPAPACPGPRSGTVSGVIEPRDVIEFAPLSAVEQGITNGEFDEMLRAIDAGAAHVLVHSTLHVPGELRGDIRGQGRDRD